MRAMRRDGLQRIGRLANRNVMLLPTVVLLPLGSHVIAASSGSSSSSMRWRRRLCRQSCVRQLLMQPRKLFQEFRDFGIVTHAHQFHLIVVLSCLCLRHMLEMLTFRALNV
eukprot:TRINITY_DN11554_c0_g1_i1.p3 TRINITY_DN11554_c0_g1~~TRINITY_DN11554_c0_g1_i1.p3  ORF type:complete len:111 (-),score=10.16 TRINITY_DN11554_c0_g1_i1:260-592(-)